MKCAESNLIHPKIIAYAQGSVFHFKILTNLLKLNHFGKEISVDHRRFIEQPLKRSKLTNKIHNCILTLLIVYGIITMREIHKK